MNEKARKIALVCTLAAILLGFGNGLHADTKVGQEPFSVLAKRTWEFLSASMDQDTAIPVDHMLLNAKGKLATADYTSITNVGLQLMSIPAAHDFGYITEKKEKELLLKIIGYLEKLPKAQDGLFYNYFEIKACKPDPKRYLSSVDNAWLAAGLWVAANTGISGVKERSLALYDKIHFTRFYDPNVKQFLLGITESTGEKQPYHYGILNTEARIISILAIAKGDVELQQWYDVFRTLPVARDWQSQKPKEFKHTANGTTYTTGTYTVDGEQIVPSWGGSLFEYLMPNLVMPEYQLSQQGFAANDKKVVRLHKKFCLETKKYLVWGLSPSAKPTDDHSFQYGEFGYPALGHKGYQGDNVITPYASLLAIDVDPEGVLKNVEALQQAYPKMWTPYGFYDGVDANNGKIAEIYLSLDQAMIFLALDNYLNDGGTRKRFFKNEIEKIGTMLLKEEKFFED